MLCAVVPSAEVLELTHELAALGGGVDVALGRAWTGVCCSGAPPPPAAAAELDAAHASASGLLDALLHELLPWLRRGFDASVLLLQGQGCLDAATLASRVGAAAFANGGSRLGVTWQLLSGGSVRGPLGAKVRPPGAPAAGKRPAAASSRPGSRLGRDSAAAAGDEEQQRQQECTTFCATSAAELQHALGAARQQLQHAAAAAGEGPPPVLLLRLELRSPAGARPQKAAALHVLQCACPGSVAGQEAQGAPQLLLKLLEEVADLHRRRREGEHLLAAAKLSPLNQLAAPLLAGGARLFVAAALPASSSDDGDSPDAPCAQQQRLLAVLAALRHVQAVCTIKSLAAEGGAAEAALPSGWLSWPQFQQQAEQQQRVERQRQAEAAALAAAEADRRQRLQQATKQRQEAAAAAAAAAKNGSAAAAKGGIAMAAAGPAATGPAAAKKQQAGGKQGAAATANCDDASHAEQPAEQPSAPADVGSPTSSLDQLRQQFQSLYQQTVGGSSAVSSLPPRPAAAAGAAGQPTPTAEPEATAAPRQHASAAAAGVAAGDDVAMHVAALRMQVAAEARRLLHAEHARSAAQHGSPAAPSPAAAAADGFSWSSGRPHSSGGGSLGQRLEEELRLLQRHAAVLAGEEGAGAGGGGWAAADHDEASLADLEGASPSLGALYRAASEPYPGLDEQQPGASGSALAAPLSAARRSTQRASAVAEAGVSTSGAAGPAVSDVFQSDWAWSPPASAAAGAAAPDGAEAVVGRSAGDSPQAASSSSVACSVSRPASASASLQHEQQQGGGSGGGSYAAAWRQRAPAAAASGSSKQGSRRPSSLQAELPQQPPGPASALVPAASAGAPAVSRRGASDAAPAVPAVPADLAAADVAELLEELHREQRINGALLQQLHEVQRQLEETAALAAAAAAAQQPPAPGVEDPADFHALLAALQLERRQSASLRQQLLLEQQQAEERQLAAEALLHTQHRQLLVASARCRAWERQTPLARLFDRYECDLRRVEGERDRLREEGAQLARLLADADVERLAAAAGRLPEEPAAVCQGYARKLQQAQAQLRRLREEHAALQKRVQGAERRDRLAELCRRQAESGARAAADLRQQLAARERQLEAQSLAAAEAAAEAERLRQRLGRQEQELAGALADRADLQDAVDSLRRQVALLKGQLGRDRVLQSMQWPAPVCAPAADASCVHAP